METRVAVVSIIVRKRRVGGVAQTPSCTNTATTSSAAWACPTRNKGINVISIAIDAPQDEISGPCPRKIGKLEGVSSTTAFSKRA